MQLFFANTSPYARKIRMVVIEKGLRDQVEMVFQNPFDESPELKVANPLGKVPCLVADDGTAVFDSPVIGAYLDNLVPSVPLFPEGSGKWSEMTREALADGVTDAAFAIVMERRRPKEEQSASWLSRWETAIFRALDEVARTINSFEGSLSMGQIALGAALGYLDFRLPDVDWRTGRPVLAEWFAAFSRRQSFMETIPPAS